ncbi:MAG: DMT family transporter [Clostridia bacterium]|nr:DMT family transporter [Clostridia bacterium]
MPYLYLVLSTISSAALTIFATVFNKINSNKKDTAILYNFLLMISVFILWGILFAFNFSFDAGVLIYSLIFSVSFICCNLGLVQALKHGPTTLTTLIVNLSLVLVTIWGFIFWQAKVTTLVIIGLVLVVISLILCLYNKKSPQKSISLKWIFYVVLAFFGNASCTISQRTQQLQYAGQHGEMLMFFATGLSVIVYAILFFKNDRSCTKIILKQSWWAPIGAGVANIGLNLFVMLLATTSLSPSLIYPFISIGGLAIVTLLSVLVFKEKMKCWQWIGIGIGAIATLLLSI